MKKFLFLLATPLLLLSLTSSCTQNKFSNRSEDQLLTDYIQAIQTRDTTMMAECFHSSVFPLFQLSRQAFANQIFDGLTEMGKEFNFRIERTYYQPDSLPKPYTYDGLQYRTLPIVWRSIYRVKSHNETSLASLKRLADIYRSSMEGLLDMQRERYQIPNEVEMISLDELKGELQILQCETNQALFESSQQEWRLVPKTYSFIRQMNKPAKPKTASNQAPHTSAE